MQTATIVFRRVGGYQPIVRWPFMVNVSAEQMGLLPELTKYGPNPADMVEFARRTMGLSATAEPTDIPGGWAQYRYAFELTFDIHASPVYKRTATVIGYTDTDAIFKDGNVDPNILLNLNTVAYTVTQRVLKNMAPMGAEVAEITLGGESYTIITPSNHSERIVTMRPEDLFVKMAVVPEFGDLVDLRDFKDLRCTPARPVSMNNNTACSAGYLARLFAAHKQAREAVYGDPFVDDDQNEFYITARAYLRNDPLEYLPGLEQLLSRYGSYEVTMGLLTEYFPALSVIVENDVAEPDADEIPAPELTVEAALAIKLSAAIPAALLSRNMRSATIDANNLSANGRVACEVSNPMKLLGNSSKDTDRLAYVLETDLATVVIPSAIPNDQMFVELLVMVDVTKDITIAIKIDGGDKKTYRFPCSCTSLYSQFVTTAQHLLEQNTADISAYLDAV